MYFDIKKKNRLVSAKQNLIVEPEERYIQMTSNLIYVAIMTPLNKI